MSKVPSLDDVRKALSAVKGSTFHIDGRLVYIYHTILHDDNYPVDLRYIITPIFTYRLSRVYHIFCDRMKRNLKDTDRAAIVPSQEEQSAMIRELYDVVMHML